MDLIVIHENRNSTRYNGHSLLRLALSTEPIADIVFDGLRSINLFRSDNGSPPDVRRIYAIPEEWGNEHLAPGPQIITYKETGKWKLVNCNYESLITNHQSLWIGLANGRFAAQANRDLLNRVLANTEADVLAVNAESGLLARHEKVRLTAKNKVAGFRRFYSDSAERAPVPTDWPHYIFVKTRALDRVLAARALPAEGGLDPVQGFALPGSFSAFLERCRSNQLTVHAVNLAGVALDLETEEGLLSLCTAALSKIQDSKLRIRNSSTISQDSKLIGKVLLGKDVRIGPKVIIVGPTIIGNNVTIGQGTVINSSIIGSRVSVPQNQFLQNRIVTAPEFAGRRPNLLTSSVPKPVSNTLLDPSHLESDNGTFRTWPKFAYARSFKRAVDCLVAIVALTLFAPIMPFIALAIKLDSPGPIFFKDKRQGLHGNVFNCLKFRSMRVGADKMQEKLRIASQVDGPQFKMKNDPRLSGVGRFLRDTYIDEVPQFLNVLLGQMSVVGPRPSPESENTSCPQWRDGRLSVRPGITGLWQVRRTRQPMKDFQEWICYDTEYVRNLSLRMDLWICWQTTKKMVKSFVDKF